MVTAESDVDVSQKKPHELLFHSGPNTYQVTPEKALALAHALLKAKRHKAALRVCERVANLDPKNPQAAILLACCEAGLKDYAACDKILHGVFSGNNEFLVEHLRAALVYHNLGMESDSTRELIALTDEDPDLPMVWLILGDYLSDLGNRKKADLCWQLAVDRDGKQGPAALAARQELLQTRLKGNPEPAP
jgi:predicted Zn-dependent protease